MNTLIRPALSLFVLLSLVTGLAYPLAVTGVARVLFPLQAAGSLVQHEGRAVGSSLIGQGFVKPGYFWSRPSATSPAYNAAGSSGSNLGPLNPALKEAVAQRIAALKKAGPVGEGPVPADLVTASASGLDPHISPAAAAWQIPRVAQARGLTADHVRELVRRHTEDRQLGFLGEPRVDVLALNLALDQATRP